MAVRSGRKIRRAAGNKSAFPLMCAVCGLIILSSCATIGREFPVARVSDIRMGETTQNDVKEMFGPPWRVGIEDGLRTWTYGKYRYRLFGRASTEDLVVRFDSKNIVTSYTFNTTEHKQ